MRNSPRNYVRSSPLSNIMNHIPKSSSKLSYVLFADDTTLSLFHKNEETLIQSVNDELKNVTNWLRDSKVLLNTNKIHMMIFSKRTIDILNYKVYLGGSEITIVSNKKKKIIRIQIDDKLCCNDHINYMYISTTASRNIGVLNKLKLPAIF